MNPFSKEKTSYSMWPIVLSLLNLPINIRTKPSSLFLVGIIPGKREAKNVDPYLELVTDELLDLPNHELYDSYKQEWFKPYGTVMLHILDYPGQNKVFKTTGMLMFHKNSEMFIPTIYFSYSGAGSYSGCCYCKVRGEYSQSLNKMVYLGHRSFLHKNDPLHADECHFPHRKDSKSKPERKTMEFIDQAIVKFMNASTKKERLKLVQSDGCKGKYILRKLPFHDRFLSMPVEPMHLIKDIIEHIVKLLGGFEDSVKVRNEEQTRNRFRCSWIEKGNSKVLPPAPFTLSKEEIHLANTRAQLVRVPLNFDWRPQRIFGAVHFKSHEWKELTCSNIVKFCLLGLLGKAQRTTLFKLFDILSSIYSPTVCEHCDIASLQESTHEVLALMERDFPVSLNVIVFHLLHHLPEYLSHYGPVHGYWMYPYERFNSWITRRIKNRRYPESNVIETYKYFDWAGFLHMSGILPSEAITMTSQSCQTSDLPVNMSKVELLVQLEEEAQIYLREIYASEIVPVYGMLHA